MILFVTTLHVILCVLLILVILFQPGKGGDVSSAFGAGASSSVFGPRGVAAPLAKITTVVAVLFMVTSITLAVHSNRGAGDIDELEEEIDALEDLKEGEGFVPAAPAEATPTLPFPGAALPGLELPPAPDGGAADPGVSAPAAGAPAAGDPAAGDPAAGDPAAGDPPADAP